MVHHLAPASVAGFVLGNGSMSSNQSGEGEIRKNLIEALQGRRTGQRRRPVALPLAALPGEILAARQQGQQAVAPQRAVIVEVLCTRARARTRAGRSDPSPCAPPTPAGGSRRHTGPAAPSGRPSSSSLRAAAIPRRPTSSSHHRNPRLRRACRAPRIATSAPPGAPLGLESAHAAQEAARVGVAVPASLAGGETAATSRPCRSEFVHGCHLAEQLIYSRPYTL